MGNRRRKSKRPPRHARRAIGGEAQAQRIVGHRADRIIIDDPFSGIDRSVAPDKLARLSHWYEGDTPGAPPIYFTTEPSADQPRISFSSLAAALGGIAGSQPVLLPQRTYDALARELGEREHERMRRELRTPEQRAHDDQVDALSYSMSWLSRSEIEMSIRSMEGAEAALARSRAMADFSRALNSQPRNRGRRR